MTGRVDSRALGLEIGLGFARVLTGREDLHYGLFDGLEPVAANFGRAQEAYSRRLFAHLPDGAGLRILDIGGGAGETARRLLALGHEVEIVVPSAVLAARCRENAPGARVHETRFEDLAAEGPFDVCLFSESFQYIPLDTALVRARGLLGSDGRIVIADCFRTEAVREARGPLRPVGGGHFLSAFEAALPRHGLRILRREDVTEAVAPSVELEQELYLAIGHALDCIDREFARARPWLHRALRFALRRMVSERRRRRLEARLHQRLRTAEAFCRYNRYLMLSLAPAPLPAD